MRVTGDVAPGFEGVRDAFAAGQADDPGGAQLSVYRHGTRVVDLWTDGPVGPDGDEFGADSLTVLRSTTKGALALCMAMLIDRGELDPDARVTRYWPEFGQNGKEEATVAQILGHTVGVPFFPVESGIRSADLPDRNRCIAALAAAEPLWRPGSTRGIYHGVTFGFLASEILRRITGTTEGAFLAEEVSAPLGLEFWIGLPADFETRVFPFGYWGAVPVADPDVPGPWQSAGVDMDDPLVATIMESSRAQSDILDFLNTREGHAMELGAGNGVSNARSVARMYAAAIGEVDGVRLISPETVALVSTSQNRLLPSLAPLEPLGDVEPDRGLGFYLNDPMPGSFGHPGAGGVHGFAHPASGVAAGYTCTGMYLGSFDSDPRVTWIAELNEIATR